MDVRQPLHSEHVKLLDTAGLRRHFLVERLFVEDEIALTYSQIDRIIVGGAMPASRELAFGPELAQKFAVGSFLERRELGARSNTELPEDARHLVRTRPHGRSPAAGDLRVAIAREECPEHHPFSLGQARDARRQGRGQHQ